MDPNSKKPAEKIQQIQLPCSQHVIIRPQIQLAQPSMRQIQLLPVNQQGQQIKFRSK